VEKATYQMATNVYPNSIGLKNIILQEGFTSENKLKVLGKGSSNGIDIDYFDPNRYSYCNKIKIREEIGIPQNDLVFIYVGRLVADKGINELVIAFKKLNILNTSTSLLLVGPFEEDLDPLRPATLETIKSHKKIFTTGYQVDVRPDFAIS